MSAWLTRLRIRFAMWLMQDTPMADMQARLKSLEQWAEVRGKTMKAPDRAPRKFTLVERQ